PVSCDYSLSPTNRTHGASPATNSVSLVTASPCPWTVINTNDWVSITTATSGTGNVTIAYTLAQNASLLERTGLVQIADAVLTIVQHGIVCDYAISPTNRTHGFGPATNSVS